MQKTMQALLTDVERRIFQSAGPSVQIYSQDILKQYIDQAFIHCFEAKYWPQYLVRETRTLNGATGKTTAPFTSILSWEDVDKVFRRYHSSPIPTMPDSYNVLDLPSGSIVRFLQPSNDDTLFTAYPLDAVDQISVVGRARPAAAGNFALADTVPFDNLALEYYAAWEYVVEDASNAAAAAKLQGLFEQRMKRLDDLAFDNIVMLSPRTETIQTEWR